MKSLFLSALAAAGLSLAPLPTFAIDYTSVTHSQLQALYYDGDSGAYGSLWSYEHPTSTLYPVQVVGLVVNNPSDMLNYDNSAVSPQWQTYIQAVNPNDYGIPYSNWSDFGGTALYMMQYSYKGSAQYYSAGEWTAEMNRVNNPYLINSTTQVSLRTGDVVLVQANAPGLDHNGKFNINEQHMKSSAYDFKITVLAQNVMPAATEITLADLKDSSNGFIFDTTMDGNNVLTRAGGCEHYQGSLVTLHDLQLVNPNASWTANSTVAVKQVGEDGVTRTFDLLLGLASGLLAEDPSSSLFDVTAILDQEDTSGTNYSGYRLWLTSASNISIVPEPGTFTLLVVGSLALSAYAWKRRK